MSILAVIEVGRRCEDDEVLKAKESAGEGDAERPIHQHHQRARGERDMSSSVRGGGWDWGASTELHGDQWAHMPQFKFL